MSSLLPIHGKEILLEDTPCSQIYSRNWWKIKFI